jgi:D-alanyl-D-alanine carboxypeptidase
MVRRPAAVRVVAAVQVMMLLGVAGCGPDGGVQELVDRWAADSEVSAAAVATVSPGGSVEFFGASATGAPPAKTDLFAVGSLTKTMVAATVLELVEEGNLELDVPIVRWLPSFPRSDQITLRQLLSHTAGIVDERGDDDFSDLSELLAAPTPDDLLERARASVGGSDLPAPHSYSNSGYWIVGAIVEEATGGSLAAAVRRHLLVPLGLTDTYLGWSEEPPRPPVPGELAGPSGGVFEVGTEALTAIMSAAWAAGGVISTAPDMATFYAALFSDLLSPSSSAALTDSAYGLGIEERQGSVPGWGHNGAVPGYAAAAIVGDNGWTVVVLSNRLQITTNGILPDTESLAAAVLGEVGR